MTELADLCAALDYVVLERLSGGFVRVGGYPAPPWFVRVFMHAQGDGPMLTLTEVFPVLDSFLEEAERFWDRMGDGRLTSEPFVVTDSLGEDLAIVATAVGSANRRYLLLQPDPAFDERQRTLQRAREQALVHEKVVRKIQELRPPIAALSRLAGGPAGLPAEGTRTTADDIAAHVAALQRIVGELPEGPRGATPRRADTTGSSSATKDGGSRAGGSG